MSNSLQPHGLQHSSLSCSSLTPGAYSKSCPSSGWCYPLLLLHSIFPSLRVFSIESVLHIRWSKYWSFSFSISPSNEYSGLISFSIDWMELLAVQGSLQMQGSPWVSRTQLKIYLITIKKKSTRDFTGSPMVKISCFYCRGHRFNPWLGNWDPSCHVVWPKTILFFKYTWVIKDS